MIFNSVIVVDLIALQVDFVGGISCADMYSFKIMWNIRVELLKAAFT